LSAQPPAPSARKSEGAFYIWSDGELVDILGEDVDVARVRFGIQKDGNAPHDPQGEFTGRNLLFVARSIEDVAAVTMKTPEEVIAALGRIRHRLFEARVARPRPHLDDKILTAWNGLMIAALARAARVLPSSPNAGAYLERARRAASFIRTTLWDEDARRLLRRYRAGEAAIDAYAEDYAYLVWALVELFQADGDPAWLEWASVLQARQDELFWDEAEAAWFSTTGSDPTVLLRLKEDYDGAEPAASSVAAMNALVLSHLAGDLSAARRAERTLARYGPRIGHAARAVPMMLCVLSAWHAGLSQVVVAGDPAVPDTRQLTEELARHYLPFAIVIPRTGAGMLDNVLPAVAAMSARDGRATAYVCRDFTCLAPATSPEALAGQLEGR
jgi:uncharacterized protein YyaL (SSP411 family)